MVAQDKSSAAVPVLLGGENRSGTTLLSVLLDSHPDLVVGPELDFVEPVDLGPHILEACDLLAAHDPRVLGPGTDTADPFWYDGAHFVKQCDRFGVPIPVLQYPVRVAMKEAGSDLVDFQDRCRLIEIIGEHRRSSTGVSRWGIKLQRKINRVDEFAAYWPQAHFVHIVRDGRDLAASHLVTVPWGFTTVTEAATGWVSVVERPPLVAPAGRYLEIRYEDLVTDPRTVLGQVVDFLGVPWHDSLLAHWQVPHSLFDAPWGHPAAEAAANPLTTARIGRFRQDLTEEQISEFERIAGDQLRRLGYPLHQTVTEDTASSR